MSGSKYCSHVLVEVDNPIWLFCYKCGIYRKKQHDGIKKSVEDAVVEKNVEGVDMKLLKPEVDIQINCASLLLDSAIKNIKSERKSLRKKKDSYMDFALDLIEADIVSAKKFLKGINEIIVGG